MESAVPRVNSALLSKNVNNTVRLVGTVLGLQGSQAVLEASDKGQVVVHLTPNSPLPVYGNGVYEVIGQVMEDMSLKELSSLRFQDGAYDAGVYDRMVSFAHKSPAVFGW